MESKKPYSEYIKSAEDLVTSREETRTGFIKYALEKNKRSTPYIQEAKIFKYEASKASIPKDLLKMDSIRSSLLTAAGLSDKALMYFTETDKDEAILSLIENFLEPEGNNFVDEAVYRFLLIKGDSLGGSMRNIVGAMAQQKLTETLISVMNARGLAHSWIYKGEWVPNTSGISFREEMIKALYWTNNGKERVLAFNQSIPLVGKNIDICLFDTDKDGYNFGKIVKTPEKLLLLGELKGGIDPAGADEHWKTGNSALERIRVAFSGADLVVKTIFLGAAIEHSMATEIYDQMSSGKLSNAANITKDNQLIELCSWLLTI